EKNMKGSSTYETAVPEGKAGWRIAINLIVIIWSGLSMAATTSGRYPMVTGKQVKKRKNY
ncbi:MAG: hypothetical protein WCB46_03070, partial [Methanoregula sp.]